jgi:hypothetical protein
MDKQQAWIGVASTGYQALYKAESAAGEGLETPHR